MAMYADVEVTTVVAKIKDAPNNTKICSACRKPVPAEEIVVVHQLRFSCGNCKYSCKTREAFWFHVVGHDVIAKKSSKHPCPMCLKEFVNKPSLQNHIVIHREQLYSECPTCQLRFIDKVNFRHHVTVYHAAAAGESVLSFLNQHRLRMTSAPMCRPCQHKNGLRCDLCYVEAMNLDRLAAHRDKAHVKCPNCEVYVVKREDLDRHMALAHDPNKQYKCSTCSVCFAKPLELSVHTSLHTTETPPKPKPPPKNAKSSTVAPQVGLKCSVCREFFQEKAELKRHIENKHFFCPLCNLVFKVGNKFSKHVQVSHSYWPIRCKFCKERCWKVFELRRHLRIKHNADYDVVGLGYHERSAKYDDDVDTVDNVATNGQNNTIIIVSNISATTATVVIPNASNSTETSSSVPVTSSDAECVIIEPLKSFKCLYCKSAYPKVATLMSHIRNSHKRTSPYHCSICNDSMWEDYVFQLHCIKHEKELSKVIIVGNVISQLPANYDLGDAGKKEVTEGSEEAELTYSCPYCPKKFSKMQHINSHVKQDHTGEAPYGCNICKQFLWELVEFEAHFRKHGSAEVPVPIVVVENRIKLESESQDGRRRIIESKLESLLEKILNVKMQRGIGLRQRDVYDILHDMLTVDNDKLPLECELGSSKPLVALEKSFKCLLHQISPSDDVNNEWIDQMSLPGLIADMDTVLQIDPLKRCK